MKKQKVNKVKIEILADGIGCDEGDVILVKEPIENGTVYSYDFGKKWFEVDISEKDITWRIMNNGNK